MLKRQRYYLEIRNYLMRLPSSSSDAITIRVLPDGGHRVVRLHLRRELGRQVLLLAAPFAARVQRQVKRSLVKGLAFHPPTAAVVGGVRQDGARLPPARNLQALPHRLVGGAAPRGANVVEVPAKQQQQQQQQQGSVIVRDNDS